MKPRHLLLAVAIAAIWGFNFTAIKLGVGAVPPFLLTGLRFLFSSVPAFLLIKPPKTDWRFVVAYGFVLGVGQFGFLFLAMKLGLAAGLASLIMQLQAPFTMLFAWVALSETPLPRQLWGAAVALGGMGVIGYERWAGPDAVPLLLCLIASAGWAGANIITKQAKPDNALSFVIWSSLVSPLPMFLASYIFEDHAVVLAALLHPTVTAIASLAYLAYASTLFGYGAWSLLLRRYPASTVAPFSLLVPIFGIIGGVMAFGERFDTFEIIGGGLVIAGLIFANLGWPKRPVARAA